MLGPCALSLRHLGTTVPQAITKDIARANFTPGGNLSLPPVTVTGRRLCFGEDGRESDRYGARVPGTGVPLMAISFTDRVQVHSCPSARAETPPRAVPASSGPC